MADILNVYQGDEVVGSAERGVDGIAKVTDRKSTRLNSSHLNESRMPSSA